MTDGTPAGWGKAHAERLQITLSVGVAEEPSFNSVGERNHGPGSMRDQDRMFYRCQPPPSAYSAEMRCRTLASPRVDFCTLSSSARSERIERVCWRRCSAQECTRKVSR